MNRTGTHWGKASRQYLVDQLPEHGWNLPKTPDETNAKLFEPELAKIMIDLLKISSINERITFYFLSYTLYEHFILFQSKVLKIFDKHGTPCTVNR